VGEDPGSDLAGQAKRLRIASSRHPHRQLALDRARHGSHLDKFAVWTRQGDRFATPQSANHLDVPQHDLFALDEVRGREHEVTGVPTRSEGDAYPPIREIVDQ